MARAASRRLVEKISVEQIAEAMVATAKHHPATSATYHYPEMMALGHVG